jgi:Cu(I)/Ag(I) efflux system membrane fusion protein
MTASVRLRGRGEEAVLIPTQALIDLGHEQRVITRQADGTFLPRLVKVLRTGGESAALSSGLAAGEEVVIFGLFLIDSEANLRGALERMRLDGESGSGAATAEAGRGEEPSAGELSRAAPGGAKEREAAEKTGALSGAEKE